MNDDTLYALLPAIYRKRDLQQGRALQAFMRVLESQYGLLQRDIQALYDNWFIETCDLWVVPYIADLLQVDYVEGQGQLLPSRRTLVANTLDHRRAKGTVQALALAAQEISGWPVFASLGADTLALTQSMQCLLPGRGGCADLRRVARADALDDSVRLPHTAELRVPRPAGDSLAGRYHLQGIALYMCRLQSYPLRRVQPCALGQRRYTFHPMGIDAPLFNAPYSDDLDRLPGSPDQLPVPLARVRLRENLRQARAGQKSREFGHHPVFGITLAWPDQPERAPHACQLKDMAIGDLSNWAPSAGAPVTVDPVLGRILMAAAEPRVPVRVDYHYGFSGDLGGGPYPRASASAAPDPQASPPWCGLVQLDGPIGPGRYADLASALLDWQASGKDGQLRIADNSTYRWGEQRSTRLELGPDLRLDIVALSDASPCIEGDLEICAAGRHGTLELNGLWCRGQILLRDASTLVLRHCTLLPGERASLRAHQGQADLQLTLDYCITGALDLQGARLHLAISNSIVDGGRAQAIRGGAGVGLTLQCCTVLGDVSGAVELIADTIIDGKLIAGADANGQVRFSYVPPASNPPRRYRSHPERDGTGQASVRPAFASRRFGAPGYCQLRSDCSEEIRHGAESGNEMGAFHQLSQHQRHQFLERVIAEYLPYPMHAGVFFLT